MTATETEVPVLNLEKGTTRMINVRYEYKHDLGDYSNHTASAWVSNIIPNDADAATVAEEMGALFSACKCAVYDELAIPYEIDPVTGAVVATATPKATSTVKQAFGGGGTPSGDGSAIRVMNKAEADEAGNGPLPPWLIEACSQHGITAVWDRRHSATGNQPQFQEAVGSGKMGHGSKSARNPSGALAFWPPK